MTGYLKGKYSTASSRWAGIGPYYAMFPAAFADRVISNYTVRGELVLDPFAGRGTSVFSAAVNGRSAIGIEINPVGWVYAQAKIHPASLDAVTERLAEIYRLSHLYKGAAKRLPIFFQLCYQPNVLQFLLAARACLRWKKRKADWTLMALLLVNLHGKRESAFSNQMRQTKSMSPRYAIQWWRSRGLKPPILDPLDFMLKRLEWRYAKGIPTVTKSQAFLGDSVELLPRISSLHGHRKKGARLLLTSPPYLGITNYHYDQWLRLWLLGGPPTSKRNASGKYKAKFESEKEYRRLLSRVFTNSKRLLIQNSVIYVRTDRRQPTFRITRDVLRETFPERKFQSKYRPCARPTQTRLFGQAISSPGEIDLILT
jgi:hypothetical protein